MARKKKIGVAVTPPTEFDVSVTTAPCFDVEIVQPDVTLEGIGMVAQGPPGPKGDKGDKGDQGDPGPPGPPGTGSGGGTIAMVWGEVPTGAIDGTNKNFGTAHTYQSNLLGVYLNGLRQRRVQDYNETSNQTFGFLSAPLPGDSVSVDYVQT